MQPRPSKSVPGDPVERVVLLEMIDNAANLLTDKLEEQMVRVIEETHAGIIKAADTNHTKSFVRRTFRRAACGRMTVRLEDGRTREAQVCCHSRGD